MSTYVYLVCADHTPPLRAAEESGQHLSDLPQIRRDITDRAVLTRLNAEADHGLDLGYFRNNTLRFLTAHPNCALLIEDEYGTQYPAHEHEWVTPPRRLSAPAGPRKCWICDATEPATRQEPTT